MMRYSIFNIVVLFIQLASVLTLIALDMKHLTKVANLSCMVVIVLGAMSNLIPKCYKWWSVRIGEE